MDQSVQIYEKMDNIIDNIIADLLKGDITVRKNLEDIYWEKNGELYSENPKSAYILNKLKIMADSGNKYAQNEVGYMYNCGAGTKQNFDKAIKYYKLSADQGYAPAQYYLGLLYRRGLGTDQDYGESVKWFKLSANQGYAPGQHNLGYMYRHGLGIKVDYSEAVKWYKLSADQGFAHAQNNLAYMYSRGLGVDENYEKAARLYILGVKQGYNISNHNLAAMCGHESRVAQFVTTLIEKNDALSAENKELKQLIEHVKLYPGSDYQQAKRDFDLLAKNTNGSLNNI